MKTKNEYSDWLKVVAKLETGKADTMEEATRGDVPLVSRRNTQRMLRQSGEIKTQTFISPGQLKAIRREFNGK